jgi:putative membrane protein
MIVRDRPNLFKLFFIFRGSVLTRIFAQVIIVFALSAVIVVAHRAIPGLVPVLSGAPFTLLGIALSVFLGFRNNACYDRWWEARKDWGQLIVSARDLCRQTLFLEAAADGDIRKRRAILCRLTIAFAQSLVGHLRPGHADSKARARLPANLLDGFLASRNPPDFILRQIGAELSGLLVQGHITDIQFSLLDATICRMAAVLAAAERIRFTPVPFGYTLLLHRTAYIFCFLLPFGFADILGWATPFASAVVAYTFFGLDALGDELEEPFGTLPNALPIAALADLIEINVLEALGETELPPSPQPRNYILT